MFSEIFRSHEYILAALFRNNKPTLFVCIPEQVYATILESPKNNDLFQNRQIYFQRNEFSCKFCLGVA